jgi:hypothetical protein
MSFDSNSSMQLLLGESWTGIHVLYQLFNNAIADHFLLQNFFNKCPNQIFLYLSYLRLVTRFCFRLLGYFFYPP